jgi:hypothetical protein
MLAKYVELESWRQAALSPTYEAVVAMRADPDFAAYATFTRRWRQDVEQMRRTADDEGDGRFYYSGMWRRSSSWIDLRRTGRRRS